MKPEFNLKGKLQKYAAAPFLLIMIMLAMDFIAAAGAKQALGFMILSTVICAFAAAAVYYYCLQKMTAEMSDYAADYAAMQKHMAGTLEIPYALLDANGKLVWMNEKFSQLTGVESGYRKSITVIFPMLTREILAKEGSEKTISGEWKNRWLKLSLYRIPGKDIADGVLTDELRALYVFDETSLHTAQMAAESQQMVSALLYIDNYDEALDSIEDVKRSLLAALVDRKVDQYFGRVDGLVRKTEKDKYFVIFKKAYLDKMVEDRFHLLEDIRGIRIGNTMALTLSMGIGIGNGSYADGNMMSRAAIDLALGRGGDQVVVKEGEHISYFGGQAGQGVSKTRVKARVKAQALQEIIESSENIIVMGHSLSDEDALGAGIGVYCAARSLGRKAQIVINNPTSSIRPLLETFTKEKGYPSDLFINSAQALEMVSRKTLVMVVDTNRPSYTECPELLQGGRRVVVLDHHRQGTEVIVNPILSYIEPYASSACEMIAEVLQYFNGGIKLNATESDCLYAGILIDTNNFMTKTGVRTFEAAAYLKRSGADVVRVRKMLRNDMACYKARAEAVHQAEVYKGAFAISVCPGENVESPTVVGAQAANELLNIIGIKASFVLTEYNDKIYVSARAIDEINVQRIMEKMGGGGHINSAGAQLKNCTMQQARAVIKTTLDEMIEKGDIKV